MTTSKDLTQVEFNNLPIGQKFIESCFSGSTFIKSVKISTTEIEKMSIDAHDFSANCETKYLTIIKILN